jgi:PAS domain S-box-containing protein
VDKTKPAKGKGDLMAGKETSTLIAIADRHQKIYWINQCFTNKTGYNPDAAYGKPLTTFLAGEGTGSHKLKELKQALSSGQNYRSTLLHYTKSGVPFWNEVMICPVVSEQQGVIEKFVFVSTDVTARIHKNEDLLYNELRWKFAIEKSGDDYFEYNLETNRFFGSENLQTLLRIKNSDAQLNLNSVIHIIHSDDTEKAVNSLFNLLSGYTDTFQEEIRIRNKQGYFTWVNVRATITNRDLKGNALHLIGTTSDISKIKETEKQLIEAKAKAEELSEYRSRFLSTMSHEIRTPLNGIIGITNLMLLENTNDAMNENLKILSFSANHLLSLINNVLDLSKIEAGKIEFAHDAFNLHETIENVCKTFQPAAKGKEVEIFSFIGKSVPRYVAGDKYRLTQVLNNLVNNAVKFTKQGKVEISLHLEKNLKNKVVIQFSIADTGIGISKANQRKIFEDFVQADSATTAKYGGTGLGLTITKKLIEMQSGKLHVESQLKKGSCFSFALAFEKAEPKQHLGKPETETVFSLNNAKILLAEDNAVNQKVALSYLAHWGAQTDCAVNGKNAFILFKEKKYELLIVDLYMPEMDGFETIAQIRKLKTGRNIPIIALTASAEQRIMAKAIDCGANICLTKPFDPQQLLTAIKKLLNKNQSAEINTGKQTQQKKKFKHINLKRLHDASLGNKAFVAEMTATIMKEVPEVIEECKTAISNMNLESVAFAVHKLKNSLLLIGLDKIEEDLKRIENKARSGKFDEIFSATIKHIEQIWAAAKKELALV